MKGLFFFSSRRRHTRYWRDWSSDVCSSDLAKFLEHPMASSSPSKQEEQNKQLVRHFFELLDRHDTDRIGQLLVSSTYYSFHIGEMTSSVDWNEHKRLLSRVNNAFPDLHHEIEDIVAEGDKVAVRLNVTGTHKGEFQGILPTGNKLSLDEMGFIAIV